MKLHSSSCPYYNRFGTPHLLQSSCPPVSRQTSVCTLHSPIRLQLYFHYFTGNLLDATPDSGGTIPCLSQFSTMPAAHSGLANSQPGPRHPRRPSHMGRRHYERCSQVTLKLPCLPQGSRSLYMKSFSVKGTNLLVTTSAKKPKLLQNKGSYCPTPIFSIFTCQLITLPT